MTPYLSADWFRLWKGALREAERLDMNLWIYDENSYPSGFAGGFVPNAMPEARGRGLVLREEKRPAAPGADILAVYRLAESGYENVTTQARADGAVPEGTYLAAAVVRAGDSPWHGGKCYVDLLYPGVTEKFLDVTLGAYLREIGASFGGRVPGSFTDEPELRPANGLAWTDDLPQAFERRWGYKLTDHLPALVRRLGEWKRVRHDYHHVLLDLFIERWGKPYYEYCERPDLYAIACNGAPVKPAPGAWWLDRAFGRIDLAEHARVGQNEVTIAGAPFRIYHELEPAYVLGDFALDATAAGFAIGPDRPLALGPWNEQGHPFFAQGVSYAEAFNLTPAPGERYAVALRRWYGSVAEVRVNGAAAGCIAYPPWECDVTEHVRLGENAIEVTVIGTLKNTLGPHHGNPGLGSAWPGMFHKGPERGPPPGEQYHTVGYGLFEPFVLRRTAAGMP
jgi:hypothetical protein